MVPKRRKMSQVVWVGSPGLGSEFPYDYIKSSTSTQKALSNHSKGTLIPSRKRLDCCRTRPASQPTPRGSRKFRRVRRSHGKEGRRYVAGGNKAAEERSMRPYYSRMGSGLQRLVRRELVE